MKQNKLIIKICVITFLCFILFGYLGAAFYHMDFDPNMWSKDARLLLIIVWMLGIPFSAVIAFTYTNEFDNIK